MPFRITFSVLPGATMRISNHSFTGGRRLAERNQLFFPMTRMQCGYLPFTNQKVSNSGLLFSRFFHGVSTIFKQSSQFNADSEPFNELGILPVRYSKDLQETIFHKYYTEEKYSVYLDNINLLYVALTRAKDVLIGFSIDNPKYENTVATTLKNALSQQDEADETVFSPGKYYNSQTRVLELGNIPGNTGKHQEKKQINSSGYLVNQVPGSLRLKLHGENYFSSEGKEIRKKINYGKLMHEVFEGINTSSDIPGAIRKLVLEGKLADSDKNIIESKINELLMQPVVSGWFSNDNLAMNEAGILLPSGVTRRPDRVIFRDGKTTIIDFKFGGESSHYNEQVSQYRKLLLEMGYKEIDAYIWYVDKNKIVPV